MRFSQREVLCATAAVISFLTTAPAVAQTESADLEEVIVTAQKRSESVQDVPASITALGTQALQERGITQASDLQFVVPSLQVGKQAGQTAVTIRGVGLNQGAPGVAIHVNGVYQPTAGMGDLAQVDIERVEVLRGPQGTLYGRNANGGVINYITKAPTDRFEGYVQGSYASYEETRLQGVINIPITERVHARALVDWWNREKGFVKNVIPGGQDVDKFNNLSGRLRVVADLTDDLDLDVTAVQVHETGPSFYYNLNAQPTPDAIAANPDLRDVIVPARPWRTSINDPADSDRYYTLLAGTLTWSLGDLQVKSITGWQRAVDKYTTDNDTVNISIFPQFSNYRSETLTQEVNLSGSFGPVDAVVGAFFMDDDQYRKSHFDIIKGSPPLPRLSQLDFESFRFDARTVAAFGDATWNVTDRLRLIAGIRVSKDKQVQVQRNFITLGPTAPTFTCPLRTNEVKFTSTTPRAGVQFDLNDESNVYFTASKGFKVGGFNFLSCNQSFKPEKITAFEAGIKNRLFHNTLTLNASAFFYDYDDLQLSQTVGLAVLITNAAAAEVKGLEVEAVWQPTAHWTLNANLSLLDAKYTSFRNVDSLNPGPGFQDVSGNYLSNAPKESANVGVSYRTDPTDAGRLTFRADVSQRTRYFFREFNNPLDGQSGFTLLNLAMIWDSPDGKYRARLYGTNVTNEDYLVRMGSATQLGGRFVTWGAPRQVGLELRANF